MEKILRVPLDPRCEHASHSRTQAMPAISFDASPLLLPWRYLIGIRNGHGYPADMPI